MLLEEEIKQFTTCVQHEDIAGNEDADRRANAAAEHDSSDLTALPQALRTPQPANVAALKRRHRAAISRVGLVASQTSPHIEKAKRRDFKTSNPRDHFLKLAAHLTRPQASLLLQLRTGHLAFNGHLHRIGRSDSPVCQARNTDNELSSILSYSALLTTNIAID